MAIDFPSSPSVGTQYVSPLGFVYLYDSSSSWTTLGDTQASNPFLNSFKYRTIYTRGYTLAGYAAGTPWSNVNRTHHATDMTTNLGDIMDRSAGYIDGGYSDYNAYTYGMSNGINTGNNSTWTSSVSMATEAGRTHDTNWDTKTTRADCAVLLNPSLTIGFITGGGTLNTDKHNYVTELMMVVGSAPANPSVSAAGAAAACFGATKGWAVASAVANFTFVTETWVNAGMTNGSDGHSKMLGTKHGFAYGHSAGNTGTAVITKWNDTTGATISAATSSPDNSGEENFQIGQNWGYCLGSYNGGYSTNTYKINYLTDVVTAMGSDTQPKGHSGLCSGAPASASSLVVGGL